MNLELIIIIGISLLTIIFIILFIRAKIKLHRLYKICVNNNKEYIHVKARLSMMEYYYRNYKEGMNPFTVLRDIGNTLDEEDIDEQKEENRA